MTHLWIILLFIWMVETCLNLRPPVGAWKFDFLLLGGRSNKTTDPLINGCSSILGQVCGALPRLWLVASFSLTDEACLDVSASQIGTFTSLKSKINIWKKKLVWPELETFEYRVTLKGWNFKGDCTELTLSDILYLGFSATVHFLVLCPIIKLVIHRSATKHLARANSSRVVQIVFAPLPKHF